MMKRWNHSEILRAHAIVKMAVSTQQYNSRKITSFFFWIKTYFVLFLVWTGVQDPIDVGFGSHGPPNSQHNRTDQLPPLSGFLQERGFTYSPLALGDFSIQTRHDEQIRPATGSEKVSIVLINRLFASNFFYFFGVLRFVLICFSLYFVQFGDTTGTWTRSFRVSW